MKGVDYFETYAPVVSWSTVRTTMTLEKNWVFVTRYVGYINDFVKDELTYNA